MYFGVPRLLSPAGAAEPSCAYVARNGVLTLDGDRELDDHSGRVETDEGLIVDEMVFLQGLHGSARIAEPQHLRGYADGRTAAVAFDNPHWSGTRYPERLFLPATNAFEHMVHSNWIYDNCFSKGGAHTFICYGYPGYGAGYSIEQPYLVLDNSTGEVVHMGCVHPYAFLDSEELIGRGRCGVFIGDDHLLLRDHRRPNALPADYPVIAKNVALPFVSLQEVSSGEKLILLEPDEEWPAEHGVDEGTIRLQRSAACDESRPLIERALETEFFRRCAEQYLPCIYSEA